MPVTMEQLFASGHAVDIVLGVMMIEAIWLLRRRLPLLDMLAMMLPGALILLALRAALTGAPWPWIAAPLLASFPIHLADVARRQRRRR